MPPTSKQTKTATSRSALLILIVAAVSSRSSRYNLQSLSRSREYLVTRYGPELAATTSQINRLTATLDEVAKKVNALVMQPSKISSIPKIVGAASTVESGPGKHAVANHAT